MSADLLRRLQEHHAFNPTPPETDLGNLHVPFDTIIGEPRYEQVLAETLRRGERVALIGPSGSGKSSVTAHVLDGFVHDMAPIRVRVGLESDSVTTDPAEFTRHLVRTVAKYIEQHESKAGEGRQAEDHARKAVRGAAPKRPVKVSLGGGTPWLQGQLAVELGAVVDSTGPSGQDILEQAQQILTLIQAWNLRPVLVLDDTDHWLVRPGLPSSKELIAGFFGHVVRLIAEQLSGAAAVIAVHETYLQDPNYLDATGFLESRVTLPEIPDASGLGRILAYRAERILEVGAPVAITQIVDGDGLQRLHGNYTAAGRSLRDHLQIVHGALTHACDVGAETINLAHIDQAIAD